MRIALSKGVMKMTADAKQEYNKLLDRFYKAEKYFESEDIPYEEKEKQLENYQEILKGLNVCLSKIKIFTANEVLGGFKI